jgi:FHA domain-containing protein
MARYRIGRADTNDIVLSESSISREHAELVELGGGRFRLVDLGSSSGTSVWQGQDWEAVTEIEVRHDTPFRLGEFQTTAAELLHDTDKTVVRARSDEAPAAPESSVSSQTAPARPPESALSSKTAPARPPAPVIVEAPAPSTPAPPRPAPPRPAAPRPPSPSQSGPPSGDATAPPRPAAPSTPSFAFLRDLPPEKRTLVWLGAGFAVFLLISLITLILAIAL